MSTVGVAVIVSLGPTFAIIATYLLNKRDSRGAARIVRTAAEKVEQTALETSEHVGEKLDEVHELVNSRLTQALKEAELERQMRAEILDRMDALEKKLNHPKEGNP